MTTFMQRAKVTDREVLMLKYISIIICVLMIRSVSPFSVSESPSTSFGKKYLYIKTLHRKEDWDFHFPKMNYHVLS